MNTPRWDRLAAQIKATMRELNMRQVDLVRESGLSIPTIRSFMSGQLRADHPTEYTIRRLEEGLTWPAGSVDRILNGEDPERALETVADVVPIERPARALSDELRAELDATYARQLLVEQAVAKLAQMSDQLQVFRSRLDDLESTEEAAARSAAQVVELREQVARLQERLDALLPPSSTASDG